MECQNDHALSLLPPVPGEYHYEVVGCGYGWMSVGLKTLRSARNLMQNTLDFDVINAVDSQHFTCTCKAIWLTCGVRWVYSITSDNGPSEKRTTSLQRTAHLPPIDFTIELIHFEPPRSGHLSTPNNGH